MAIDKGEETVTLRTQERTWRIEIESPAGQMPYITAHRETIVSLPDGTVVGKESGIQVRRNLEQLSKDAEALAMAAAIPDIIDRWRKDDLAKGSDGL